MSELIHQFGIDWKLLLAQAINFGALFFILYRFAYHPVLAVLRERRKKIEEGIAMREESERRLDAAKREREVMLKKTNQESVEVIAKAEVQGKVRGDEIIQGAKTKQEEIIQEGRKRADEEQRLMRELFSKEAEELVRNAVAKIAEKSPSSFDASLIQHALTEAKRLQI